MPPPPVSKSTFLAFLACPKDSWLRLHKPELFKALEPLPPERSLAEQASEVEEYAHKLFPNGILITATGKTACVETNRHMLSRAPAIFHATFSADGFGTKLDVLAHDAKNKRWDMYEVKGTNSVKEGAPGKDSIVSLAFQASVLRRAAVPLGRCFLVYLNKEYVRDGALEVDKLFLTEDVTEKVLARLSRVERHMERAKEYLSREEEPTIGCDCTYKGRSAHCTTFGYSNPQVPEYSIHDLAHIGASKKKIATLVERRALNLSEIPADLKLSETQSNQVHVHVTQYPLIDRHNIQKELEALVFPLYFLDYETFAPALPLFNGYGPHTKIPFQFSLHTLRHPDAQPEHVEYLHEEYSDPSIPLAETLIRYLHPEGAVIAWNKSFERTVNKELAARLPEYASSLKRINSRMYDLQDIFRKQFYVHPAFRGKTSIKKVLPALIPGTHYAGLPIKEGTHASDAWHRMISSTTSPQENSQIAHDLRAYCELDTYAMYQIWKYLANLTLSTKP